MTTPKMPTISEMMKQQTPGKELKGFSPAELHARATGALPSSGQEQPPAPKTDALPDAEQRAQAQIASDPQTPAEKRAAKSTAAQQDDAAAFRQASIDKAAKLAAPKGGAK